MKACYAKCITARNDRELAETFFNSITRRVFATVGVDPQIEFVASDFDPLPRSSGRPAFRSYALEGNLAEVLKRILEDCRVGAPFAAIERQTPVLAERIQRNLGPAAAANGRLEVSECLFYRSKGAYLVGRIRRGDETLPLVVALRHGPEGVLVDAVLTDEVSVSILFSFTRSPFFASIRRPCDMVGFLKTILPRKRTAELYTIIGYHKHGKTELYRDILAFTRECGDQHFDISPGKPGLVMIVFNMPGDDLVLKVIRDRFRSPKETSRRAVIEKYDLVFRHDRAGRLVEAHSFEHLKFDRCWFSEDLAQELKREAAGTVTFAEGEVIIEHAYVQRRVTPLDLFLLEAEAEAASAAVIDYGNAIKDLAASNIFAGDMLLKNFGVTRHGRVVFYDFDELCPLTDCRFRRIPAARNDWDDFMDEPWFQVDPNDVFPEELSRFLGLPPDLQETFEGRHADLFDVAFWENTQLEARSGNIVDILPYSTEHRLPCG
jgi:isocitrate dehydrogenase kinase/phosphatase